MTTGPGSETIRVVPADQQYIVNWNTDQFGVQPGETYRVNVFGFAELLGFVDVQVAASGKEARNVTTSELIGPADGRTLPIKFRIEEGAAAEEFPIEADEGGTIESSDGSVSLVVPPAALTTDEEITVEPVDATGAVQSAVEFGPDGLQLKEPVIITLSYDVATPPAGMAEEDLALQTFVDNEWIVVPGSTVSGGTVSGAVRHSYTVRAGAGATSRLSDGLFGPTLRNPGGWAARPCDTARAARTPDRLRRTRDPGSGPGGDKVNRISRRTAAAVLLSLLPACGQAGPDATRDSDAGSNDVGSTATSGPVGNQPNIVLVVVDDLRWDEFGAAGHPWTETPNIDRLAREGVMFTNAFHAVPLCSPNRASILTGQYPSRHGIIDNVARNLASHRLTTFPQALQAAGYETGFVGKWHMGNDPTPRPGFDYWVGLPGQGRIIDPILYEAGALAEVEGYVTDVLTDRALRFIEAEHAAPFFVMLNHKAIHPDARQLDDGSVDLDYPMVFTPAGRHMGLYENETFPRRDNVPSGSAEPASDAVRSALRARGSDAIAATFGPDFLDPLTSDETIRRRAEMLLSVDEGLGRIIDALERRGILDETVILFTSDNGYFFGEHGFSIERRMPYEESIRNPLLIRYPPLAEAGSRPEGLALSIDIAPTLLEIGGADIGPQIQGRSLVPLLRGQTTQWRDAVLIEFYTYENPMPWLVDHDYRAIRTDRYKLIHWTHYEDELYDLADDPYEMRNLIGDAGMEDVHASLRERLAELILEALGLGNR